MRNPMREPQIPRWRCDRSGITQAGSPFPAGCAHPFPAGSYWQWACCATGQDGPATGIGGEWKEHLSRRSLGTHEISRGTRKLDPHAAHMRSLAKLRGVRALTSLGRSSPGDWGTDTKATQGGAALSLAEDVGAQGHPLLGWAAPSPSLLSLHPQRHCGPFAKAGATEPAPGVLVGSAGPRLLPLRFSLGLSSPLGTDPALPRGHPPPARQGLLGTD